MSGFATALPVLLGLEGGLVDHEDDRGGRTNFGVTQPVYNRYRAKRGLPIRPVDFIEPDEVEDLYHVLYWLEAKCDAVPWPVSHVLFDGAVHHGPRQSVRFLQRAVGVEPDGDLGPITAKAVADAHEADRLDGVSDLIGRVLWQRFSMMLDIVNRRPSQRTFWRGWCNRIEELRTLYNVG